MIKQLSLDDVVEAVEQESVDFSPLPKGTYNVVLESVGDWKEKILPSVDIKEKGTVVDTVKNYKMFNCNLKFKVLDGDYAGRLLFHNITTHPNMPWSVSGFLYAMGVPKMKLSQVKNLVGSTCTAYVDTRSYDKKITDKETGMETIETVVENEIKRFGLLTRDNDIDIDSI